jgi:purine-nucleoside phosphorylase
VSDYDAVHRSADAVRAACGGALDVAVVLGSGLGDVAGLVQAPCAVSYDQLPHWPASTVSGHAGRLVVGTLRGRRVAVLSGRAHGYEGHDAAAVTFAVRVMGVLGVRVLMLTNAAGGITPTLAPGRLMAITDHLNLTGGNPLVGRNDERFGPRFPDMSEVYSRRLIEAADAAAAAAGVALARGVYAGLLGPSFETPAEVRMLRGMGADAVGFSTVLEAIAARHMGIEVLGVTCITNMAAGMLPQPLTHQEVLDTTARVCGDVAAVVSGVIARL